MVFRILNVGRTILVNVLQIPSENSLIFENRNDVKKRWRGKREEKAKEREVKKREKEETTRGVDPSSR